MTNATEQVGEAGAPAAVGEAGAAAGKAGAPAAVGEAGAAAEAPCYTIGQAAERLGLPASTIRFYDRKGLLPHIPRSEGGIRLFSDEELGWLRMVEYLKRSGMTINEIKSFIDLMLEGDATIGARRDLLHARRVKMEQELERMQTALDFISYKCWYYDTALEAGTCDVPQNMPLDQMPADVRRMKERCLQDPQGV